VNVAQQQAIGESVLEPLLQQNFVSSVDFFESHLDIAMRRRVDLFTDVIGGNW
jgi:hypothetical protein